MAEQDLVDIHIERCIECWTEGVTPQQYEEQPSRESYENIRHDLLVAVGMLQALNSIVKHDIKKRAE